MIAEAHPQQTGPVDETHELMPDEDEPVLVLPALPEMPLMPLPVQFNFIAERVNGVGIEADRAVARQSPLTVIRTEARFGPAAQHAQREVEPVARTRLRGGSDRCRRGRANGMSNSASDPRIPSWITRQSTTSGQPARSSQRTGKLW